MLLNVDVEGWMECACSGVFETTLKFWHAGCIPSYKYSPPLRPRKINEHEPSYFSTKQRCQYYYKWNGPWQLTVAPLFLSINITLSHCIVFQSTDIGFVRQTGEGLLSAKFRLVNLRRYIRSWASAKTDHRRYLQLRKQCSLLLMLLLRARIQSPNVLLTLNNDHRRRCMVQHEDSECDRLNALI